MAVDPRKFRVPAVAFTMTLLLTAYVRSSIQQARLESQMRQRKDLISHNEDKASPMRGSASAER